jgi:hypothetical protein
MNDIDPAIFLNIGKRLSENQQYQMEANENIPKKSLQEYKSTYLNKLNEQIENLIENRDKLITEFKHRMEFNKLSIEKITYYNKKLGNNKNIINNNHTIATFISLRMKHINQILNETIENNIKNSQTMHELEKEIYFTEYCIKKTQGYIQLNL